MGTDKKQAKERLLALYAECKQLREAMEVDGAPGEDIWQAELDDKNILVTSDGLGGATLMIAAGNCHTEFIVDESRDFDDSEEACDAAGRLLAAWEGRENDKGVKEDYGDVKDEVFSAEAAEASQP